MADCYNFMSTKMKYNHHKQNRLKKLVSYYM